MARLCNRPVSRASLSERLHSQADAIDARFNHRLQGRIRQLSRCALHRDFCGALDIKPAAKLSKQPPEVAGLKQRWRAAAQVDCVDRVRKIDNRRGPGPRPVKSSISRLMRSARSRIPPEAKLQWCIWNGKRHRDIDAERVVGLVTSSSIVSCECGNSKHDADAAFHAIDFLMIRRL